MNISIVVLSIPIFFVLMGIEFIVDKWKHTHTYRLNDTVANLSNGVGQQVFGIFLKVFSILAYEYIFAHFALFKIPDNALSFVVLFFAYDFLYYWAHRWSHTVNFLWAGHVVHHQSEEYNLSVALRQSWFQSVFTSFIFYPLAIAGFSTKLMIGVAAWNLLYQFWIHTEFINKMGFLELFMNTPSHHRVHHGRNPKYIDKNHAGVFIIWDKLFGTFQAEEEKPVYGITTPINSWNPFWANFSHYFQMAAQIRETSNWLDKLKVIFMKPGWRPAALGGTLPIPEVNNQTYHKFDNPVPSQANVYVLFQYATTLIGTTFFLFQYKTLTLTWQVIFAACIGWAIADACGILEGKKAYIYAEIARWIVSFGLLAYFFWGN